MAGGHRFVFKFKEHLDAVGKPVLHLDKQGKVIREYASTSAAAKDLGLVNQEIGRVCNGRRESIHGLFFRWKHSGDEMTRAENEAPSASSPPPNPAVPSKKRPAPSSSSSSVYPLVPQAKLTKEKKAQSVTSTQATTSTNKGGCSSSSSSSRKVVPARPPVAPTTKPTTRGKPPPPLREVVFTPLPVSTGTRHSARPSLPNTVYSDTTMHNSSALLRGLSSSAHSSSSARSTSSLQKFVARSHYRQQRAEPTLQERRQHFAEKEVEAKYQALKVVLKKEFWFLLFILHYGCFIPVKVCFFKDLHPCCLPSPSCQFLASVFIPFLATYSV
jgi:hypothetical protein